MQWQDIVRWVEQNIRGPGNTAVCEGSFTAKAQGTQGNNLKWITAYTVMACTDMHFANLAFLAPLR